MSKTSENHKMPDRFFITALIIIAGCVRPAVAQEHTKDSLDTVKKALADKKAVLIDVREKSEWDDGHLKDAKLLPLSSLKGASLPADLDKILPKEKIAYLHCASGKRVLKAAEILRKNGFDVRPLKDGYKELLNTGFPKAETAEPKKLNPADCLGNEAHSAPRPDAGIGSPKYYANISGFFCLICVRITP
jgi:phage shock protein E